MKNFLSFSSNPGTTGLRYYSYFFKKYNIDAVYIPKKAENLNDAIGYARSVKASGFSVSMPFKKEIITYLNEMDASVFEYATCNTVKIVDDKLIGYNADYLGALAILKLIKPYHHVTILGNGAMGSMLHKLIPNAKLISRSLKNWEDRILGSDVIINCSALGTISEESPFVELPKTNLVIDLALKNNNLKLQCQLKNVKYVSGIYFYKHNFLEQFKIYTGIRLHENEFEEL